MEEAIVENRDSMDVRSLAGKRFCWVSGMAQRPKGWWGDWWLQVAHIAPGQGSAMRVDDRRAVVLLSPLAHSLHVVDRKATPEMSVNGRTYRTVDIANLLYVKAFFDPDFYDEEYLSRLFNKRLPRPEPPDDYWMRSMMDMQGIQICNQQPS